jgi:hypothetical protein
VQSSRTVIVVFVLAAAGAGFLVWRAKRPPTAAVRAPAPVARPATPTVAPTPPPPPAKPAIEHPLAEEAPGSELPELDASDAFFKKALGDLVRSKSGLSFFVLDQFARRIVATVNNLDTDTAASDLWPVAPTPGRLDVTETAEGATIFRSNATRYNVFVRLVEDIDTRRAVSLYRRAYPLLQKAYEDLGAPGRYFNDRVVKVIDDLLATPDVTGPIRVRRAGGDGGTTPSGSRASLFLFSDPTLEARSTGQKILLRMGTDNAAKLKAKLADIRRLIVVRAP